MRAHDVFVSYGREDRNAAMRIAARLELEGFAVWWDAAIHSGETFDEVIERQLRAAKAAVVLWSPRSVTSRWVRAEATLADRRNILVPVIIEACDLPILFELTHTIDLSTWQGDRDDPVWQRLVEDIRFLVGPENEAPAAKPASAPARGFLLSDDGDDIDRSIPSSRRAPHEDITPAAPPAVKLNGAAKVQVDEDYEPTAFYSGTGGYVELEDGQVHYLEVGPEEAPLEKHAISLLGAKIGRSAPADIVLADNRISRRHCTVELKDGELLVSDLHSTNGTFVDGERIFGPTVLPQGSELKLGSVTLTHRVRSSAGMR
ncbi:TIR domain-containing protein [Altererythrobacter arenosus]|uniref:TIR domain-containing protein n=1 Tax=Altererythrobacter arenosus TaxID=3032592 RepID=A0ABY8FR78_9SPHN|nr:TIR domain-containing protein [Altererythrobacter sp. CAU 1644]WFL77519.1 TIR domain-containing protein [Altererythrobacter sp. CAU 1644]